MIVFLVVTLCWVTAHPVAEHQRMGTNSHRARYLIAFQSTKTVIGLYVCLKPNNFKELDIF